MLRGLGENRASFATKSTNKPVHSSHAADQALGVHGEDGTAQASQAKVQAGDWLTLLPVSASDSSQTGISTPWHPASGADGGAALPPRGGSGNGALAATVARVQGHTAPLQVPPAPASTPAVPFLPSTGSTASSAPANGAAGNRAGPVVTRNAAATDLAQGSGGSSGRSVAADAGAGSSASPMGPSIIAENPSSLPSSTVGNGSGSAQMSFPYFPLYVLDENNGIVLFNNQYQQASLNGVVDLDAQVKGTTVSTYNWTTSNLNIASSSGASTYHFHFQLTGTEIAPAVGSVSLTVTNSSSQQESETFYFVVPTSNVVALPTSSSWPVTISPDLVEPGARPSPARGSRWTPTPAPSTPTSTCPATTRTFLPSR